MTAQTWTSLKKTVALALTQQQGLDLDTYGALFEAQFPQATSYAENRIYREIPMLAQRRADASLSTSSGDRTLDMSALSPPVLVVEQVSLITPASTSNPALGTRVPYASVSLDFINMVWPVQATTQAPSLAWQGGRYFALQDAYTVVLAPTPDGVYFAEITGLFSPTPISAGNPSTYLSEVYPELLEAGCLVFLTGALTRNFGAQADEPKSAVSWEAQFRTLLQAAQGEERRRRGLLPDVT